MNHYNYENKMNLFYCHSIIEHYIITIQFLQSTLFVIVNEIILPMKLGYVSCFLYPEAW